ncbi:hypothetical protein NYO99_15030 [Pelomonas sp. UHG3]|jgi:hypothetical protein|uniref:Uncharacterized protein n=1 Tax=Roseateles hydrophilus TaxID=2975054 RepID=A0ACC6CD03_9BURK|nr:hypothetical protein [Pelomonas sp. UHG3]MCY4746298.1 hypothetical protein [Pelomonas sp. UHG3]
MLGLLAACQPALNWREVRPEKSGVVAMFPCKPEVEQRSGMGLAQCEADGGRFSLSWADVPEPSQAGPALNAMAAAVAAKLALPPPQAQRLTVPGMTPLPEAAQYLLNGAGSVSRVGVFSHGARVYQVMMSSPKVDGVAWDSFVAGLRIEMGR